VTVDDGLDAEVELFAVGQEFVEIYFAEDGAESGLGKLRGLVDVVIDLDDGASGVDDAQGDDGIYFEGDVVAGDDVLRGDFHGLLTEGDADDLVEGAEDPDDARAFGGFFDASQPEDHASLVLFEDVQGVDDVEDDDDDCEEDRERHHWVGPRVELRTTLRL